MIGCNASILTDRHVGAYYLCYETKHRCNSRKDHSSYRKKAHVLWANNSRKNKVTVQSKLVWLLASHWSLDLQQLQQKKMAS